MSWASILSCPTFPFYKLPPPLPIPPFLPQLLLFLSLLELYFLLTGFLGLRSFPLTDCSTHLFILHAMPLIPKGILLILSVPWEFGLCWHRCLFIEFCRSLKLTTFRREFIVIPCLGNSSSWTLNDNCWATSCNWSWSQQSSHAFPALSSVCNPSYKAISLCIFRLSNISLFFHHFSCMSASLLKQLYFNIILTYLILFLFWF